MKKICLTAALLLLPVSGFAEKGHIADDVYVFMHGGPSNQYRIIGRVRSGSPINILSKSGDGKFVQVRTSGGKTGWVDANHVNSGDSMQARMPQLESALETSQSTVESQAQEISNLRTELDTFKVENSTYTEQLTKLKTEIKDLNRQIDNMDESNLMQWFSYGGLVALGGVILGLLLPYLPRKKQRRDEWF